MRLVFLSWLFIACCSWHFAATTLFSAVQAVEIIDFDRIGQVDQRGVCTTDQLRLQVAAAGQALVQFLENIADDIILLRETLLYQYNLDEDVKGYPPSMLAVPKAESKDGYFSFYAPRWSFNSSMDAQCLADNVESGGHLRQVNELFNKCLIPNETHVLTELCTHKENYRYKDCPDPLLTYNNPISLKNWYATSGEDKQCPVYCLNPRRFNNSIFNYFRSFVAPIDRIVPSIMAKSKTSIFNLYVNWWRGTYMQRAVFPIPLSVIVGHDYFNLFVTDQKDERTRLNDFSARLTTSYFHPIANNFVVSIFTPIWLHNHFDSIVTADLSVNDMGDLLREYTGTSEGATWLANSKSSDIVAGSPNTYNLLFRMGCLNGVCRSAANVLAELTKDPNFDATKYYGLSILYSDTGFAGLKDAMHVNANSGFMMYNRQSQLGSTNLIRGEDATDDDFYVAWQAMPPSSILLFDDLLTVSVFPMRSVKSLLSWSLTPRILTAEVPLGHKGVFTYSARIDVSNLGFVPVQFDLSLPTLSVGNYSSLSITPLTGIIDGYSQLQLHLSYSLYDAPFVMDAMRGVDATHFISLLQSSRPLCSSALSIDFSVVFSDLVVCSQGQQKVISATGIVSCHSCPVDSYNLAPGLPCMACAVGAICEGGNQIFSRKGYWQGDDGEYYRCFEERACCPDNHCPSIRGNLVLGDDTPDPRCDSNRKGVLCGECLPGASEWNGVCVMCGQVDVGMVAGAIVFMLGVVLLFVGLSYKSAYDQNRAMYILLGIIRQEDSSSEQQQEKEMGEVAPIAVAAISVSVASGGEEGRHAENSLNVNCCAADDVSNVVQAEDGKEEFEKHTEVKKGEESKTSEQEQNDRVQKVNFSVQEKKRAEEGKQKRNETKERGTRNSTGNLSVTSPFASSMDVLLNIVTENGVFGEDDRERTSSSVRHHSYLPYSPGADPSPSSRGSDFTSSLQQSSTLLAHSGKSKTIEQIAKEAGETLRRKRAATNAIPKKDSLDEHGGVDYGNRDERRGKETSKPVVIEGSVSDKTAKRPGDEEANALAEKMLVISTLETVISRNTRGVIFSLCVDYYQVAALVLTSSETLVDELFYMDLEMFANSQPQICAMYLNPYSKFLLPIYAVALLFCIWIVVCYGFFRVLRLSCRWFSTVFTKTIGSMPFHVIAVGSCFRLILLTFPTVLRTSLYSLDCVKIAGESSRMRHALSIECWSGSHTTMAVLLTVIAVAVLLIPLLLSINFRKTRQRRDLLWNDVRIQVKNQQEREQAAAAEYERTELTEHATFVGQREQEKEGGRGGDDAAFGEQQGLISDNIHDAFSCRSSLEQAYTAYLRDMYYFGHLFCNYQQHVAWWYEAWFVFRRCVIILVYVTMVDDVEGRKTALASVLCVGCAVHCINMPFKAPQLNFLQFFLFLSLLLLVSLPMDSEQPFVKVVTHTLLILPLLWVLKDALRGNSLLNNSCFPFCDRHGPERKGSEKTRGETKRDGSLADGSVADGRDSNLNTNGGIDLGMLLENEEQLTIKHSDIAFFASTVDERVSIASRPSYHQTMRALRAKRPTSGMSNEGYSSGTHSGLVQPI